MQEQTRSYTGAIFLPLRLVAGWLFLSAVHRRLILAPAKHEFLSEQWLGHKINTFFPHSNGIFHTALEYMVQNPVALDIFTYVFTFSELILGILLILGFVSRFTGVFLAGLSIGLMHTAGWLGPTCLDEWQIASLLTTIGAVMAFYGGGIFSVDNWLMKKYPPLKENKWWRLVAFPDFNTQSPRFRHIAIGLSVALTFYVVIMNQVHHGGVWGNLHNYSKKPGIILSNLNVADKNTFSFTAYRDKGPEAYGTFIFKVTLKDASGDVIHNYDRKYLKNMPEEDITNKHVNKISTDTHSLQIALGARGKLTFDLPDGKTLKPDKNYSVTLTEIGGRSFTVSSE